MYTIYIDIVELKSVTYPENSYTSIVIWYGFTRGIWKVLHIRALYKSERRYIQLIYTKQNRESTKGYSRWKVE